MLHMDPMVVRMDQRVNQRVATQIVRRISESGSANADLATHLGMSDATLLRRLTAQTSFTVAELAQAAEFLNCTLSDLIPVSGPAVKSA